MMITSQDPYFLGVTRVIQSFVWSPEMLLPRLNVSDGRDSSAWFAYHIPVVSGAVMIND